MEHVWAARSRARVERWRARARQMRQNARSARRRGDLLEAAASDARERYAQNRAVSVAMPRAMRLDVCRKRWASFKCGCQEVSRPVGCDQPLLCSWCRRRHFVRWRRRIVRPFAAHERAAAAAWRARGAPLGEEPRPLLMTLTVAHSGSVERDRKDIADGWRRFYAWLSETIGRRFAYVLTWEVTPGDDGAGHVHAHVALVAPFFDWRAAHDAWCAACPRSNHISLQSTTRGRDGKPRRIRAEDAAYYVSKYVTKGVDVGDFTGQLAGEVLTAFYGKRKVTTSLHFYRPIASAKACCKRCQVEWHVSERPKGLAKVAPSGVWFALLGCSVVASSRGSPQERLRRQLLGDVAVARRRSHEGEWPDGGRSATAAAER